MKVFVTGVGGQLGHDTVLELTGRGHEVVGSDIQDVYSGVPDKAAEVPYVQLDITDRGAVMKMITEMKPDAVIHCAAMTAVDRCESDRELAWKLNAFGTGVVAAACRRRNVRLIAISTDYVFAGDLDRRLDVGRIILVDGVAVQIQHHLDAGVLLEIRLDRRLGVPVGAVVGLIVDGGIVNDADARRLQAQIDRPQFRPFLLGQRVLHQAALAPGRIAGGIQPEGPIGRLQGGGICLLRLIDLALPAAEAAFQADLALRGKAGLQAAPYLGLAEVDVLLIRQHDQAGAEGDQLLGLLCRELQIRRLKLAAHLVKVQNPVRQDAQPVQLCQGLGTALGGIPKPGVPGAEYTTATAGTQKGIAIPGHILHIIKSPRRHRIPAAVATKFPDLPPSDRDRLQNRKFHPKFLL